MVTQKKQLLGYQKSAILDELRDPIQISKEGNMYLGTNDSEWLGAKNSNME